MEKEQLAKILQDHRNWLNDVAGGIRANLSGANLSQSTGLLSAIDYIKSHFETNAEGVIAYKVFGGTYCAPKDWKIETGSIINENVNTNRTDPCGCGINVAPLEWVKNQYAGEIWQVLIRWEWLAGVVVPYNTDGKIRCERVQLVKIMEDLPSVNEHGHKT